MKHIKLTEKEVKELKLLHKRIKDQKKADRIKAILMLNNDYSAKEVAKVLLLDENTITNYKQRFLYRTSIENWLEDNIIRYGGKLSKTQELCVKNFVIQSIITNVETVTTFILNLFGIKYAQSSVNALLHRLGFVFKSSKNLPSKLDPVKQAEFKKEYEKLEDYLMENESLLFIDGVHPQHNTKPTGVWVLKGKEKVIKSNTGRARLNINGAYNPHTQDLIVREDETINTQSTIELFKQIENYYTKKKTIYVIADNARYYRNMNVKKYLENSKIKLIFLPSYSPNLNLIERLWRFLRKEVINTTYYSSFKDFKEAVMGFLENIHLKREEVRRFVGTKLHLLEAV